MPKSWANKRTCKQPANHPHATSHPVHGTYWASYWAGQIPDHSWQINMLKPTHMPCMHSCSSVPLSPQPAHARHHRDTCRHSKVEGGLR